MLYKTHLTTSSAIAIPILAATNELSIVTCSGVALGALLPDIDTPNSFIGKRLKIISRPINSFFGHRGVIHSITPVVILLILSFIFKSSFLWAITFGFLLHLIEDTFSEKGIKWFAPFSELNIRIPFEILRYKTGGLKEYVILGIALTSLYFQLRNGHYMSEGINQFSSLITNTITSLIHI
ncbi:metal-dependent hydrolase [Clostridium perfringens]|nr:metal-dependent hydrolase [Clostridium perfringens]EGT0013573.1 metal-dependent hydrolase [Clostridium perfringens]